MENRRRTSRLISFFGIAFVASSAVIGATAAKVPPSQVSAAEDCDVEDGSKECFILHLEYVACLLTGKSTCVLPCCSLERPEGPSQPD